MKWPFFGERTSNELRNPSRKTPNLSLGFFARASGLVQAGLEKFQSGRLLVVRYLASCATMTTGVVAHMVGFIILARALGAEQFGLLQIVTTAAGLGLVWCGIGSGELMRRRVSRDLQEYPSVLGHVIILYLSTGVLLSAAVTLILTFTLEVVAGFSGNLRIFALLVFGNLLLYSWIAVCEVILLTHDNYRLANIVDVSSGIARAVAAAIASIGFNVQTVEAWAYWHFGFYSLVAIGATIAIAGYGRPRWTIYWKEIPKGATICLTGTFMAVRSNADILILAATTSPAIVGVYSVARRIVGTSYVAGAALDRMIYGDLARAGKKSTQAALSLAQQYAKYAIAVSFMATIGLLVIAPFVPLIFGEAYRNAIPTLQILSFTTVLVALQWLASDSLNASEHHHTRLVVEIVASSIGLCILLVLTYAYGLPGMLTSIYIGGTITVAALWSALRYRAELVPIPKTNP